MTGDAFTTAAVALRRSAVGWQTAIAPCLGVDPRTVRRWLQDGATPDWVDVRMVELMGGVGPSPWPRDEWLIGDAVTRDGRAREYIAHLVPPRFVARIVAMEDGAVEDTELPADVVSGTVYQADADTLLCEIDWIDAVPAGEIAHLLEAAADAIDTQTGRDEGHGWSGR